MKAVLEAAHFHNEEAAFKYVEALIWPAGPVCPHCGETGRVGVLAGATTRFGLKKCYACRKPFTVRVGTVFEHSHAPLRKWLQAIHLIASSKKGISSNQLSRTLGVTLRTAWHMSHRIREAMAAGGLVAFGAGGGAVEADEMFTGNNPERPPEDGKRVNTSNKNIVLTVVDRDTGQAKSELMDSLTGPEVTVTLTKTVSREAHLMTDKAQHYLPHSWSVATHESVNHGAGEYARGDVSVNLVEGYFSVFKRGMTGVYQHCSRRHLPRYLAEFDFRHNYRVALGVNDVERADRIVAGALGKTLRYKRLVGDRPKTKEVVIPGTWDDWKTV